MYIQNTTVPYEEVDYKGIAYDVCVDYAHISRYKGLRQVIHNFDDFSNRYVSLETNNAFSSHSDVIFYDVPSEYENRLDIIAHKFLGSASYAWVIVYFNGISDGYTVHEGQRLQIPKNLTSLFNSGEVLAPIPALALNLGTE